MHKRGNCLSDQTSINWSYDVYYCVDMEPLPAVIQGSFYGSRICGTRSGTPFVDAIRVDESGKCPDGTKPCSSNTSLQNTICYPPEDLDSSCPITDIDIIEMSGAETKKKSRNNGDNVIQLDSSHAITYSKDRDSLPITTIIVDEQPCIRNSYNFMSAESTKFLPYEIMRTDECMEG